MTRIGNTADYGVSGLDEGQAASLLSAVGGHGLSLVEPGPATDPARAGLGPMAALDRARRAWERTSPQLVIDGWLDHLDELDARQTGVLSCVEPAGLTSGAEPCYGSPEGLTASQVQAVAPSACLPLPDGSAPSHHYAPGRALHAEVVRGRVQRGA